jgi:quinol monooxygenase YgiN
MKAKLLVILFSMALISSSYGSKKTTQYSEGPTNLKQASVEENGMMIIAKLKVKADKIKAFTEAAKEMIENSNKEAGCISYQLYQDPYDNTRFVFVEEYKNQAAVDAHFASDYFKAFGPKVGDLVAEPGKIKIVTVAKEVNQ